MKNNTAKGKKGELVACNYLEIKGYSILNKNYRSGRAEIDIIAEKENVLVFIEVKARADKKFGEPEMSVGGKKRNLLKFAAEQYIFLVDWKKEIRFDIISITSFPTLEIIHFEDVDWN